MNLWVGLDIGGEDLGMLPEVPQEGVTASVAHYLHVEQDRGFPEEVLRPSLCTHTLVLTVVETMLLLLLTLEAT